MNTAGRQTRRKHGPEGKSHGHGFVRTTATKENAARATANFHSSSCRDRYAAASSRPAVALGRPSVTWSSPASLRPSLVPPGTSSKRAYHGCVRARAYYTRRDGTPAGVTTLSLPRIRIIYRALYKHAARYLSFIIIIVGRPPSSSVPNVRSDEISSTLETVVA